MFSQISDHCVRYLIPSDNGSFAPGERLLNMAWYCNLPESSEDFANAMTDKNGRRHRNTLPRGGMRENVWAKQKAHGQAVLPEPFREVLNKIELPFITAVSDFHSPRASYCNGRLLLVGDALALIRPHTGIGANQGAFDCLLLERVFKDKIQISEWNRQVTEYAFLNVLRSRTWGYYYLDGYIAYALSELRYRANLTFNRLFKL